MKLQLVLVLIAMSGVFAVEIKRPSVDGYDLDWCMDLIGAWT
jgi:hypothetical protein